jgi:hypothetical protein
MTFSLVQLSPLPLPFSKYSIYRQCVAVREWGGWILLDTIFCRSLKLRIWPDSEPPKLLDHPKQKTRTGGGLRQIKTWRKVPLQVNFLVTTFCFGFYIDNYSVVSSEPNIISIAKTSLSSMKFWFFPPVKRHGTSTRRKINLKGVWHEIFDFKFFHESVSPRPPSIPFVREYLRKFSEKFEMVLMGYSGARGTLIYEKNLKAKISCQTHFNKLD